MLAEYFYSFLFSCQFPVAGSQLSFDYLLATENWQPGTISSTS